MYRVKTLNNISPRGLAQFPSEKYELSHDISEPDAILVRSYNMHALSFPSSVQVVGRAGAGTNNIPIDQLTGMGVPVLNTPGANANAVKELVLAGILLASRNICNAWRYVSELTVNDPKELHQEVENNKKQFVGSELPGKTLGIIGLGNIGVQLANAASHLGMHVIGFDAEISVKNAWQLSSKVERADHIDQVLQCADFVSIHVPLTEQTRHLINDQKFKLMKKGSVLLNFAREGIIDIQALLSALAAQQLRYYVCDFPDPAYQNHPQVITLPHLGASTHEAEENCAMMIAAQVKSYLEEGHIHNSVNFPDVKLLRLNKDSQRLAVINSNVPNMVAQIFTVLSKANVNIVDMINKSKGEIAYTLVDMNTSIDATVLKKIQSIEGVIRARCL